MFEKIIPVLRRASTPLLQQGSSHAQMGKVFNPNALPLMAQRNNASFTGVQSLNVQDSYIGLPTAPKWGVMVQQFAQPENNIIEVAASRFMANGRTNSLTKTLQAEGLPADVARGFASDLVKDPTSYDTHNDLYNALHREGKSLDAAAQTVQKLAQEQQQAAKNEAHQDKVLQHRQQPGKGLGAKPANRAADEPNHTARPDPIPTTNMSPRPSC